MVPQIRLSHLQSQAIPHSAQQQHTTFFRKAATLQPGPSSHVNEHNKPSLASSIPHASSHLISSRFISSPLLPSPQSVQDDSSEDLSCFASPPLFHGLTRCTSHPIPSVTCPNPCIRIRKHSSPGRVLHVIKGFVRTGIDVFNMGVFD